MGVQWTIQNRPYMIGRGKSLTALSLSRANPEGFALSSLARPSGDDKLISNPTYDQAWAFVQGIHDKVGTLKDKAFEIASDIAMVYKYEYWKALNYDSWEECREYEFADTIELIRLSVDERLAIIEELDSSGMNKKEISAVLGTSYRQVMRDTKALRARESTSQVTFENSLTRDNDDHCPQSTAFQAQDRQYGTPVSNALNTDICDYTDKNVKPEDGDDGPRYADWISEEAANNMIIKIPDAGQLSMTTLEELGYTEEQFAEFQALSKPGLANEDQHEGGSELVVHEPKASHQPAVYEPRDEYVARDQPTLPPSYQQIDRASYLRPSEIMDAMLPKLEHESTARNSPEISNRARPTKAERKTPPPPVEDLETWTGVKEHGRSMNVESQVSTHNESMNDGDEAFTNYPTSIAQENLTQCCKHCVNLLTFEQLDTAYQERKKSMLP